MPRRSILPQLFDIYQDIAGEIPVSIIDEWNESKKDEAAAFDILAPFEVRGTLVSSDTAGLSRLSQTRDLIDVLGMISKPKEIVYGLGTSIGGESIGVWAADNTQMFYNEKVQPQLVLSMLLETQDRVNNLNTVRIGFGAHTGTFYKIGGGMYGVEADFIEEVAENDTEGGEIVVSESMRQTVESQDLFAFSPKEDLDDRLQKVYRCLSGPRYEFISDLNINYPYPYSEDFFADLHRFYERPTEPLLDELNKKYTKEEVIVLIEREGLIEPVTEIRILEEISRDDVMKKIVEKLLEKYNGEDIKTVSRLGIYVFDGIKTATAFSKQLREQMKERNMSCRIGIDRGDVLTFNLKNSGRDIAGDPVNIASKMAQDFGEQGKIYITARALKKTDTSEMEKFECEISRVTLKGYVM